MNIPNGYFVKWSDGCNTHNGVVVQLQCGEQWILFPEEGLHSPLADSIKRNQIKEVRRDSNGLGCAGWISNFDRVWLHAIPVEFEFTFEITRKKRVVAKGVTKAEAQANAIALAQNGKGWGLATKVVDSTQILA